jgi:hypothetical protein
MRAAGAPAARSAPNHRYEVSNMVSFKAFSAVAAFTALCIYGLVLLGVGAHHQDPLWALGTAFAFIAILTIDVWMFFAIAKDEPFRWE